MSNNYQNSMYTIMHNLQSKISILHSNSSFTLKSQQSVELNITHTYDFSEDRKIVTGLLTMTLALNTPSRTASFQGILHVSTICWVNICAHHKSPIIPIRNVSLYTLDLTTKYNLKVGLHWKLGDWICASFHIWCLLNLLLKLCCCWTRIHFGTIILCQNLTLLEMFLPACQYF